MRCSSSRFPPDLTCEGALQESPPLISPIRAAAVGLLELMRTGPLISMECRWGGGASMGLWDMVREVKECRFLLFFFSPARWAPLLWGPEEAPSPESPLDSDGLSNSISCRAAELNYERAREAGGQQRGRSKVEITDRGEGVVKLRVLKRSWKLSLSIITMTVMEDSIFRKSLEMLSSRMIHQVFTLLVWGSWARKVQALWPRQAPVRWKSKEEH